MSLNQDKLEQLKDTIDNTICDQDIIDYFNQKSILSDTTRLTIRVDDVSIGMSVLKRKQWFDEDIIEVLEELIAMLKAPIVVDKEIF